MKKITRALAAVLLCALLMLCAPFAAAMSRSAHLSCAAHGGGNRCQSHVRADAAQCCFAS